MRFYEVSTLYVSCFDDGKKYNGYYPSPTGRGADGPLFSLQEAIDCVAEIRGGGALQPIVIKIIGGEYFIESPVRISSPVSNIIIEPYGDNTVVFNAGKRIDGFKKAVFNGKECLGTYIEDVKTGKWNFTDLYVNGRRADYTRYPESGFLFKISAENPGEELYDSSKWFIADKNDLNEIENIEDCILSYCHYWIDEHSPIESYDRETGKLTMAYNSRFNINHNFQYYLENVPSMFGKPNQWYLDRKNGMLYYLPISSELTSGDLCVYAPVSDFILGLSEVQSVRIKGIEFKNSRGDYSSNQDVFGNLQNKKYASDAQGVSNAKGIVNFERSSGITIEDCCFSDFGLHGINVGDGCRNIKIIGNTFSDGGAGGIKVDGGEYGRRPDTFIHNVEISDNHIKRCGRRYFSACGVLVKNASECKIIHNHIEDLFYTGISVGWTWGYRPNVSRENLISKNHIHNIGQGMLSDMGGIYLLGAQPGTVVSYNLIHDVKSLEYGGWAIYNDEGSSGIVVENNVCYNVSENCYHMNYGTSNLIRNNIFAFAGKEILRVTKPEKHLSNFYENNILYSSGVPIHRFELLQLEEMNFFCRGNILFDSSRKGDILYIDADGFRSFSDAREKGLEEGSIVADPLFSDADGYNFSISKDSPAFDIGFKPFDISDAGVRK